VGDKVVGVFVRFSCRFILHQVASRPSTVPLSRETLR
jgi:hypothetical protein